MRAEYEKDADLLVIELEPFDGPTEGDQLAEGPIIEYLEINLPVSAEILTASSDLYGKLYAVAKRTGADAPALFAIAEGAIENPDTLVTHGLEVKVGQHLTRA